ncbi:hypothetical protein CDAR_600881 [Caerostris darwini]|uniref:Uncharacterized protein n=1 Tax=Caerostris darwini TaxID=1538125 RepID=A0AAV4TWG1_9ARAC|nr:hypothetical protein CDAR_600881 [Caerostris darwini]
MNSPSIPVAPNVLRLLHGDSSMDSFEQTPLRGILLFYYKPTPPPPQFTIEIPYIYMTWTPPFYTFLRVPSSLQFWGNACVFEVLMNGSRVRWKLLLLPFHDGF